MMEKRTVPVQHLRYALTTALGRLIEKEAAVHPFVIVEHELSGLFLQFAGSKDEPLSFDVPQQGIILQPCTSVSDAVERAVNMVDDWLLNKDEKLSLTENEDNGLRRRFGKWLKKIQGRLVPAEE